MTARDDAFDIGASYIRMAEQIKEEEAREQAKQVRADGGQGSWTRGTLQFGEVPRAGDSED